MKQTILSEQKKVRLSIITDNAGTYFSVSTQNYKGEWIRRNRYNPTGRGLEKALCLFYRLILCEINANIVIDIDNDIHNVL